MIAVLLAGFTTASGSFLWEGRGIPEEMIWLTDWDRVVRSDGPPMCTAGVDCGNGVDTDRERGKVMKPSDDGSRFEIDPGDGVDSVNQMV